MGQPAVMALLPLFSQLAALWLLRFIVDAQWDDKERLSVTISARLEIGDATIGATEHPTAELAAVPWSGRPWPSHLDGINYRWRSPKELSPAEKYAKAFGLDVEPFLDRLSRVSGVDSSPSGVKCKTEADCRQGHVCARRRGAGTTTGTCHVPTTALQDAWALAAVTLQSPRCAVEKNGVTFHPEDIKALLAQVQLHSELEQQSLFGLSPRKYVRFGQDDNLNCDVFAIMGIRTDWCSETFHRSVVSPVFFYFSLVSSFGAADVPMLIRFANESQYFPIYSYRVQEMYSMPREAAMSRYPSLKLRKESEAIFIHFEIDWVLNAADVDLETEDAVVTSVFALVAESRSGGFEVEVSYLNLVWLNTSSPLVPASFEVVAVPQVPISGYLGLDSQLVYDLLRSSILCSHKAAAVSRSRRCNRLPYDIVRQKMSDHVRRCQADTAFDFESPAPMTDEQLMVACRHRDCISVMDAIRRIGFRDYFEIIRTVDIGALWPKPAAQTS
ncbi:hypothetical protein ATCC90586_010726 [Pythium insidiosum]|nr:hypothetical protein ATCC90586_010726 [Pythium insidiosum]